MGTEGEGREKSTKCHFSNQKCIIAIYHTSYTKNINYTKMSSPSSSDSAVTSINKYQQMAKWRQENKHPPFFSETEWPTQAWIAWAKKDQEHFLSQFEGSLHDHSKVFDIQSQWHAAHPKYNYDSRTFDMLHQRFKDTYYNVKIREKHAEKDQKQKEEDEKNGYTYKWCTVPKCSCKGMFFTRGPGATRPTNGYCINHAPLTTNYFTDLVAAASRPCSIVGCTKTGYLDRQGRMLCSLHYLLDSKSTPATEAKPEHKRATCTFPGCINVGDMKEEQHDESTFKCIVHFEEKKTEEKTNKKRKTQEK